MKRADVCCALGVVLLACISCAMTEQAASPSLQSMQTVRPEANTLAGGRFLDWGSYELEIGRDASYVRLIPDRGATGKYGIHLNATKLLEAGPCYDCLTTSNLHLLPNGDVSIDISITHPYTDRRYTGFDVRGIIMFPASQPFPDPELSELVGLPPHPIVARIASHEKGDAELMNPDGWTTIWSPDVDELWVPWDQIEEGDYPILKYYKGKYASGDNLGVINAFRRFHSNENRHMFEVGKTVTRTYVIRPPASGPIKASYAICAHWAPATNTPVVDPATDFPAVASSPTPYEFTISQDAPMDPDKETTESAKHLHYHIKAWYTDSSSWIVSLPDLGHVCNPGGEFEPYPGGEPDEYYFCGFCPDPFDQIPGYLPADCPYVCRLEMRDPEHVWGAGKPLGTDFYIFKIAIEASDGE